VSLIHKNWKVRVTMGHKIVNCVLVDIMQLHIIKNIHQWHVWTDVHFNTLRDLHMCITKEKKLPLPFMNFT
jgi:hypothetical protein